MPTKIYIEGKSIIIDDGVNGGLYSHDEILATFDRANGLFIFKISENRGFNIAYNLIQDGDGLQAGATFEDTKTYLSPIVNFIPATGASGVSWGDINGTLSNQTDLVSEFTTKQDVFNGLILVNNSNVATTLGGVIDSDKIYFLDEKIDISTNQIDLSGGKTLSLRGHNFKNSGLYSTENNYTMVIGADASDILGIDYFISVSGANSQVYDVTSGTGFDAYELIRVNYDNCTSLGNLTNYRQGLETGSGRFGGSPSLTLTGTWVGGFRITTSIVRGLDAGMTEPLFKAGVGFNMASRFLTDINVDLPTSAAFLDFSDANFVNPSTLILSGATITRNGIINPDDVNITPNISSSSIASFWKNNQGVRNTFLGGGLTITTEATTVIGGGDQGVFFDLNGTFSSSDLQHFDQPSNGQLRHLGDSPREFKLFASLIIDSAQNQEVDIKVVVWDNSASVFVDYKLVRRVINNLQGGRDIAYFTFSDNVILGQNDYVKLMTSNFTGTQNITAELDSEFIIEER